MDNNLEFQPEDLERKEQEPKVNLKVEEIIEKTEPAIKELKQKSIIDFCEHQNKILIKNIIIDTENRRQLDPDNIERISESIKINGLMHPIIITRDNRLVAGWHRIEAFKQNGKEKIPFVYTNKTDPLELKLQQIDENIVRGELTTLEECLQLKERKEIYEKLYPETKAGIIGGLTGGRGRTKIANEKISVAKKKSFTQDTADKINKSDRTIQLKTKIANNLIPEIIPELLDTNLAKRQKDLQRISKLESDQQKELLKTIKKIKSENVKIKNLDKILLQKNESEKKEQKETFSEILKNLKDKLETVKEYLSEKILEYDFRGYLFVKDEEGVIDYKVRYKKLQNTDLWREGKRLKFEINNLNNIEQPEWKNSALHHENPYPWEHLFSKGIIIHKSKHKRGG